MRATNDGGDSILDKEDILEPDISMGMSNNRPLTKITECNCKK
jgi:hypothetical protein